jgi:hypothetical protein
MNVEYRISNDEFRSSKTLTFRPLYPTSSFDIRYSIFDIRKGWPMQDLRSLVTMAVGATALAILAVPRPLDAQEGPRLPAIALYSAFAFSVGADLSTTLMFQSRCAGCYESNRLMAPFVKSGPVPLVAATVAVNAGLVGLSEYVRRQEATEKVWWCCVQGVALFGPRRC